MRRFLYYIPNVGGANAQMLSDRGLLGRFSQGIGRETVEHSVTASIEGPKERGDKNPPRVGCLVAAGLRPAKFEPDRQRWIPLLSTSHQQPATSNHSFPYVGVEDIAQPPRPADLERESGVAGYDLKLADGNVWRVPLVRRWDAQQLEHVAALPEAITGEAAGGRYRFVTRVRPEFAEIDAIGESLFSAFNTRATTTIEDLFDLASRLLAVNYRLGPEEAMLLGLFTVETAMECLRLAIDTPAMRACGKRIARQGIVPRQTARPRAERVEEEKVESREPLTPSAALSPLAVGEFHG